jgi:hypothetical protein
MAVVSHQVIVALRDLFAMRFSEDELRDLSFALEIDYDDIPGETRIAKARELPRYLNRRGQVDKLRGVGPQVRDDIDWDSILGETTPQPVEVNPNRVAGPELAAVATIIATLPDFMSQVDRKTMLIIADVDRYMGGVDLAGPERPVSLRVLTHLNGLSEPGQPDTPLGQFLRYIVSLPDVRPDQQALIQYLIATYHL